MIRKIDKLKLILDESSIDYESRLADAVTAKATGTAKVYIMLTDGSIYFVKDHAEAKKIESKTAYDIKEEMDIDEYIRYLTRRLNIKKAGDIIEIVKRKYKKSPPILRKALKFGLGLAGLGELGNLIKTGKRGY